MAKQLNKYTGSVKPWSEKAKEYGLNDKQVKFCELYANGSQEDEIPIGNGIQAYAKAYEINLAKPGAYNTAKSNAHRLLTNQNVLDYINHIFEHCGLNDADVDQQLLFAIKQNADFGSKVAAIKHYNELKGRVKKQEGNTLLQFNINLQSSGEATEMQPAIDVNAKV